MFPSICVGTSCLYASIINSAKQWIATFVLLAHTPPQSHYKFFPQATFPKKQSILLSNTGYIQQFVAQSLKNTCEEAKKKHYFLKVYCNISYSQALRGGENDIDLLSFSAWC